MGRRGSATTLDANEVDRIQKNAIQRIEKTGKTLYEVLNSHMEDDTSELKKQYKRLIRRLHPDRNSSDDAGIEFENVQSAFKVLKNPETRRIYDKMGYSGLYVAESLQRENSAEREGGDGCSRCGSILFQVVGVLTLGYCCYCMCFCCNCCCGTCNGCAKRLFGKRLYHMYEQAVSEAEVEELIEFEDGHGVGGGKRGMTSLKSTSSIVSTEPKKVHDAWEVITTTTTTSTTTSTTATPFKKKETGEETFISNAQTSSTNPSKTSNTHTSDGKTEESSEHNSSNKLQVKEGRVRTSSFGSRPKHLQQAAAKTPSKKTTFDSKSNAVTEVVVDSVPLNHKHEGEEDELPVVKSKTINFRNVVVEDCDDDDDEEEEEEEEIEEEEQKTNRATPIPSVTPLTPTAMNNLISKRPPSYYQDTLSFIQKCVFKI
eukprot:m.73962 g.73962  ORF g.73962 m.73962 type:complete len:429 (-) comp11788_c2_seq3:2553-3839(-)